MASISTSTPNPAIAVEKHEHTGSLLTAAGKVRREVPLPSQEKKGGALEYALFVS